MKTKITKQQKVLSNVGKNGIVSVRGMDIPVIITQAKYSYGRERYKVIPVGGTTETGWLENVRISK